MSQIAVDGRPCWKRNAPSDETVRSFGVRNREICLQTTANKGEVKRKGKTTVICKLFLTNVSQYLGILEYGGREWSMNESAVEMKFV